jgi:hypothetical protein
MPTDLTNTAISTTYKGILQSQGVPLSAGRTIIYDGVGTKTALSLGTANAGVSITGVTSGSCQFYTNILTTAADTPNTLITKSYADSLSSSSGNPLGSYPVGSVYISVVATNPGITFGGTWQALAPGRVLMGVGTVIDNQTIPQCRTFTAGACGGELNHVLTKCEMPSHGHSVGGVVNQLVTKSTCNGASGCNQAHFVYTTTGSTGACGGDIPHNNLQPYLVVYMWQRTA